MCLRLAVVDGFCEVLVVYVRRYGCSYDPNILTWFGLRPSCYLLPLGMSCWCFALLLLRRPYTNVFIFSLYMCTAIRFGAAVKVHVYCHRPCRGCRLHARYSLVIDHAFDSTRGVVQAVEPVYTALLILTTPRTDRSDRSSSRSYRSDRS